MFGCWYLLVRPEAIAFGTDLCFTADVLYSNCEIYKTGRPIGAKFCTVISSRPNFIMPVQNFGALPQKNLGAKNMQNLTRFWTTLNFGGEYLQNGWRYSKSDKYTFTKCVLWRNDKSLGGRRWYHRIERRSLPISCQQ